MHRSIVIGLLLLCALCLGSAGTLQGTGVGGMVSLGPAAHAGVECSDCHLSRSRDAEIQALTGARCRPCHDPTGTGEAEPTLRFHAAGGRDCLDCHSFHEPELIVAGAARVPFDYAQADLAGHCASCHAAEGNLDHLSPGHTEAAAFYHGGTQTLKDLTPSEGCLACHSSEASPLGRGPGSYRPAPRFLASAGHVYGVPVVLGSEISSYSIRWQLDPRIHLFEDRIECQTCHQIAGRTEKLLVEFETPYALCLGCHERRSAVLRVAER